MDHSAKVRREVHPREKANIFSLLTFVYTGRLFVKGFKKDLDDDDIYDVTKNCRSKRAADKLEQAYFSKAKIKEPGKNVSLISILWNLYGIRYIALGLLQMTGKLLLSILVPDALAHLISYFKPGQTKMTIYDALYFAAIMIGVRAFHTIYFQNYQIFLTELAIQIKVAFSSVIYRKALRLSPRALEETSLGNIVTVITKDVQQFELSSPVFNELWTSFIQMLVSCYLIYNRIGAISLVGIIPVLSLVPIQASISKVVRNLRLKMALKTDERLQRMQEALSTIKTIKMYTWEQLFVDTIADARVKELKLLLKSAYCRFGLKVSGQLLGKISFYLIIMTYMWIHNDMSPEDIFYVMKVFNTLQMSIAMSFTMSFTRIAALLASMSRIDHVLQLEELPDHIDKPDDEPLIDLRNVCLNLNDKEILKNVNIKMESGLNVLTGPLGCGKSSLIKVILRAYPIEGEIRTRGVKSYASQDPWLFPSSIKQNILFGEKYDYKKYIQVIKACALEYDFGILENGDETIIADRGMNLSKGQQARINLARAIYKDSDIYLLDDSLTALDNQVQDHIFNHCIKGLLKNKCVVLVTHNAKHIKEADKLILFEKDRVNHVENPENISEKLIEAIESETHEETDKTDQNEDDCDNEDEMLLKPKSLIPKKQVYHEIKKTGTINNKVYINYVKYGGGFLMALLIIAFYSGETLIESTAEKLLSTWINKKAVITQIKEKEFKNTTIDPESFNIENVTTVFLNATYNISTNVFHNIGKREMEATKTMNLYTMAILTFAVLALLQSFLLYSFTLKSSKNLHNLMVKRVLNSVMTFFDNYYIGNILNRFIQDLSVVDEQLSTTLAQFLGAIFHLAGIIGLVASVNWKFLVPALVLAVFSIILRAIYIRTSRSLKRLVAATRSPLIGHLNSTMEGLTTIKAYRAQDILKNEFDKHQDLYTSVLFTSFCVNGAFGFVMEISSLFLVSSIILRFFFFDIGFNAGDVGLALTQAGMFSMVIDHTLTAWSEIENNMTSVERAMEYTVLENESKTGSEVENWPTKGEVIYDSVVLKYANSQENILKNISFEVKPKQKIGIVGRTGAGKSSIISTLFRLYNYQGKIIIDGIELKTLSLSFLRQHISIIPQDPIMFYGTIRSNVDPFGEFTDEDIWKTLHKVQLHDKIATLETSVKDTSFSTGQRQLMCVARAIIRKNKIVVLDEATANMDPETEQLAQKIIDENFAHCTLFVIAHRLDTILDCDKILVLDRGAIVEYDEPAALLKNPKGQFSQMLVNAGMQSIASKHAAPF